MFAKTLIPFILTIALGLAGCSPSSEAPGTAGEAAQPDAPPTVVFSPRADIQTALQEALIVAQPGTTIQLEEGIYAFTAGLSLDVDGVTIRGRGMDRTIFDFAGQDRPAAKACMSPATASCSRTSPSRTPRATASRSQGADNVIFRRLIVTWAAGPTPRTAPTGSTQCSRLNVLVEDCVASARPPTPASTSGSRRTSSCATTSSRERGRIEIENSFGADVYGNVATSNTGGIVVFYAARPAGQGRPRHPRASTTRSTTTTTPTSAVRALMATLPPGTGMPSWPARTSRCSRTASKDTTPTAC